MCVNVYGIDHMRCKYKSKGIYMPNTCKRRNHFVENGPEVRVRCNKKEKTIYKIKAKNTFLNGQWLEDTSMSNIWKKKKGFLWTMVQMST